MKRILVLCQRDWLNPRAGAVEHYLHEVCARIVAQGHYVAWVAHHFRNPGDGMPKRSRMEFVDGVHIARLGQRISTAKWSALSSNA